MSLYHVYSNTVADGTATSVVRPSDWNSAHSQVMTLAGNTVGASTVSGTNIVFQGGNNVTLSANQAASVATIVFSGPTQSVQTQASGNIAGAGFTSTTTAGTAVVATQNSAGLSMGIPQYLTTYQNDLTSGRAGTGFTSTTTAGTAVVATLNTNGLSMGVPQYVTTYDATSGRAGTGFTSTTTAGTAIVATQNTAGLSIGVPAYLTTAAQSNHSHNFATTTTNGSQIVVGTANSAGATIGVPPFITTFTQPGATVFSNSNNVSFGLNGSTVTATATFAQSNQTANFYVNGNTTQLSSTAGIDLRSVSFEGAGIASVGVSNGKVLVSVPAGGGGGDGYNIVAMGTDPVNGSTSGATFSTLSGSVYLQAGDNITLSQTSNSIYVSAAAGGGGGETRQYFDNLGPLATASGAMGGKAVQYRTVWFSPLEPFNGKFDADMTMNTLAIDMSLSGSTATMSVPFTSTVSIGLYTLISTNATLSMSLINSASASFGFAAAATNNSTAFAAQRYLTIHSSAWSEQPVLTNGGRYIVGMVWNSSSTSLNVAQSILGGYVNSTAARSGYIGNSGTTATWQGAGQFVGHYSATSTALPTAVNYTQVNKQAASANFVPHLIIFNYTNVTL